MILWKSLFCVPRTLRNISRDDGSRIKIAVKISLIVLCSSYVGFIIISFTLLVGLTFSRVQGGLDLPGNWAKLETCDIDSFQDESETGFDMFLFRVFHQSRMSQSKFCSLNSIFICYQTQIWILCRNSVYYKF